MAQRGAGARSPGPRPSGPAPPRPGLPRPAPPRQGLPRPAPPRRSPGAVSAHPASQVPRPISRPTPSSPPSAEVLPVSAPPGPNRSASSGAPAGLQGAQCLRPQLRCPPEARRRPPRRARPSPCPSTTATTSRMKATEYAAAVGLESGPLLSDRAWALDDESGNRGRVLGALEANQRPSCPRQSTSSHIYSAASSGTAAIHGSGMVSGSSRRRVAPGRVGVLAARRVCVPRVPGESRRWQRSISLRTRCQRNISLSKI